MRILRLALTVLLPLATSCSGDDHIKCGEGTELVGDTCVGEDAPRSDVDADTDTDTGPTACPSVEGKWLVYAKGYRTHTPSTDGSADRREYFVEIGYHHFDADGSASTQIFRFVASSNLHPNATPYRHFAACGTDCEQGFFYIPRYSDSVQPDGTWSTEDCNIDNIDIHTDDTARSWRAEDDTAYGLEAMAASGGTPTHDNVVGFAYLTDIDPEEGLPVDSSSLLAARYFSELYQNNGTVDSDWTYYDTVAFDYYLLPASPDPDLIGAASRCDDPASQTYSDLLFNYAPVSPRVIYANYGHEFTGDDCFNETNHTTMLWAVPDEAGTLSKMVLVEYSYESDGYPIFSVGRLHP